MILPEELLRSLRQLGPEYSELGDVLANTPPSTSIHLNPGKLPTRPELPNRVPWCPEGHTLQSRPSFTFDPCMHQGLYYVQDASSMIMSAVLRHIVGQRTEPLRLLDACAAPGGKTLCALDTLPPRSQIHANEYDLRRCSVLAENLAKWGRADTLVTNDSTSTLATHMAGYYDIALCDAPCSGEGMIRREPDVVTSWSYELVQHCATRQREIVADVWRCVKPGGYMVYSTCTFNRYENEAIVEWLIREHQATSVDTGLLAQYPQLLPGVMTDAHCLRLIPGRVNGEGQFVAVLRKDYDCTVDLRPERSRWPRRVRQAPPSLIAQAHEWIDTQRPWRMAFGENSSLWAVPDDHSLIIDYIFKNFHLRVACILIGYLKGRSMVPSQPMAMAQCLRPTAFPSHDVDYSTAIRYLRGEALEAIPTCPRGIVLLTYMGRPLGFVKNVGGRANNLYPTQGRILSTHIPDAFMSIHMPWYHPGSLV